jgi:5-methylcytosine-specific restriction endonuclease McrA
VPLFQVARSGRWRAVRARFLEENPECAASGVKVKLEVHHCIPFHVDPSKELDPDNLIVLTTDFRGFDLHRLIGHRGRWSDVNTNVRQDAAYFRRMLERE